MRNLGMFKGRRGLVLLVAALVSITACLAIPTESRMVGGQVGLRRFVGYWAVHVEDGPLADGILVFHVDTTEGGLALADVPTRDWTRQWQSGLGIVSSSCVA